MGNNEEHEDVICVECIGEIFTTGPPNAKGNAMNTVFSKMNAAANQRNPGDEAAPGTPQTGEDICPECNGSGKMPDRAQCNNCGGTGRIVKNVGDA
jgi:DnaJ-class molecular chaperone